MSLDFSLSQKNSLQGPSKKMHPNFQNLIGITTDLLTLCDWFSRRLWQRCTINECSSSLKSKQEIRSSHTRNIGKAQHAIYTLQQTIFLCINKIPSIFCILYTLYNKSDIIRVWYPKHLPFCICGCAFFQCKHRILYDECIAVRQPKSCLLKHHLNDL